MARRRIKRASMEIEIPEGVAPEAYAMLITAELKGCEFRGAEGRKLTFALGRNRIARFRAAVKKLGIKRENIERVCKSWRQYRDW